MLLFVVALQAEAAPIIAALSLHKDMAPSAFPVYVGPDAALTVSGVGKVRAAMAAAPANLTFAGYVDQAALRDAYCGADAFVFCSHEETEGIVVLEALACGAPTLLREIPVYEDWLKDGETVYKAGSEAQFYAKLRAMLNGTLPDLTAAGRAAAESRSLAAVGRQLLTLYPQLPVQKKLAFLRRKCYASE